MKYLFRDAKSRSWTRCPTSMVKRVFAFAAIVILFAAATLALSIGPREPAPPEEAPALSEDGEQADDETEKARPHPHRPAGPFDEQEMEFHGAPRTPAS